MDVEGDNRANEGHGVGGGSAGLGGDGEMVRVGVLRVGNQVEVLWLDERDWFGGRVGEGALEEGAMVIEYFDGSQVEGRCFLSARQGSLECIKREPRSEATCRQLNHHNEKLRHPRVHH
ncbi:hypothetical protein CYMTET_22961 [Cymbomonas tetramitiformis]|uniref:Tudor domain-containing protein n=1 Tax=Cymbomonas tetramitiformis TaxID=36881 RepID=A0AAE0FZ66_9CHLO|nr:hypothetical protein CYMTET_22961 [Cymbomonas tetramitiformis]